MTDCGFLPVAVTCRWIAADGGRVVRRPGHAPRQRPRRERLVALGGAVGHAGMFGTAGDLARLGEMLRLGGALDGVRILRADTVAEMCTDQLPRHLTRRFPAGPGRAHRRPASMGALRGRSRRWATPGSRARRWIIDRARRPDRGAAHQPGAPQSHLVGRGPRASGACGRGGRHGAAGPRDAGRHRTGRPGGARAPGTHPCRAARAPTGGATRRARHPRRPGACRAAVHRHAARNVATPPPRPCCASAAPWASALPGTAPRAGARDRTRGERPGRAVTDW